MLEKIYLQFFGDEKVSLTYLVYEACSQCKVKISLNYL